MKPRQTVPRPDFEIPDLTAEQQEAMNLPADFWDAFDQHFRSTPSVSDALDDRFDALVRLSELTAIPAPSSRDEDIEEWEVYTSVGGEITFTRGNAVFCYCEPAVKRALAEYSASLRALHRSQMLESIRLEQTPVWMFLPVRRDRISTSSIAHIVETLAREGLDSHDANADAAFFPVEEIERMHRLYVTGKTTEEMLAEAEKLHSFTRWPGDEELPLP